MGEAVTLTDAGHTGEMKRLYIGKIGGIP